MKGDYKELEDLKMATQEPVIAEPDIHGGIVLDESCRFLLVMSAGLYKSIEEATGKDQVNKYIAQCVVEQVCYLLFPLFLLFYFLFSVQRTSNFNRGSPGSCGQSSSFAP